MFFLSLRKSKPGEPTSGSRTAWVFSFTVPSFLSTAIFVVLLYVLRFTGLEIPFVHITAHQKLEERELNFLFLRS